MLAAGRLRSPSKSLANNASRASRYSYSAPAIDSVDPGSVGRPRSRPASQSSGGGGGIAGGGGRSGVARQLVLKMRSSGIQLGLSGGVLVQSSAALPKPSGGLVTFANGTMAPAVMLWSRQRVRLKLTLNSAPKRPSSPSQEFDTRKLALGSSESSR